MATKKAAKKYRNAITFSSRNSARIRLRQRSASFSQTVNEDLTAYYELLDCMSISMHNFFNPPRKLQYYCAAIHEMERININTRLPTQFAVAEGLSRGRARARLPGRWKRAPVKG